MLPEADRNRIIHMREAAQQSLEFVTSRKRNDLELDPQLRLAVLRALEVFGEAASRVSLETRAAHPEIPCRAAVSIRNRLIHAYFDVNYDIVWNTVAEALPPLLPIIDAALESDTDG